MDTSIANPKILEGIRIVDMTSVIFGPYATQTLADCGAEVIKVESPRGDFFRGAGKPVNTKGMGAVHMTLNRGKRAITLDLRDEDDAAVMRDLIETADVFIHNVRKAGVERIGFGYEAVKKIKPDIVYVHCTGFGSGGPYEPLQCYDDVVQAASGLTSLMPRADGNPKPRYVPSAIVDKVAGLHGAYATMAGIIHKLRTGEGQFIEVPMFEAFTQFLLEEHLFGATFDPPKETILYKRQIAPDRQPSPTKDGHMSIVPYVDENWARTFEIMGDPDFLERAGLTTPVDRFRNQDKMNARIDELAPAKTNAEWTKLFNDANIPCMAARDIDTIMDDPHLKATGFFKRKDHPTEGGYYEMQPAVRFGARPDPEIGPAPRIDEHGEQIREELAQRKAAE